MSSPPLLVSEILAPGQVISPQVSITTAIKLINDHFDYQVKKITQLNSYDDKNFYVEAIKRRSSGDYGDGPTQMFVFKVLNSMDSRKGHTAAENIAMTFLQSKGLNCPVPVVSVHEGSTCPLVEIHGQNDEKNSGEGHCSFHLIRLLSFVEGQILHDIKITEKLLFEVGFYSGELLTHLKDFKHPGLENHQSIWMLCSTPRLTDFIYVIESQKDRFQLVSQVLEAFEQIVIPAYPNLRKGIIHGDLNEQNIIVRKTECVNYSGGNPMDNTTYSIAGIIDFADLQENYHVFELALLITYMMLECLKTEIDPLEGSAHVLAGFMQTRQVSKHELDVLRICVAARLCQSLVLGQYSYSLNPTNQYLLTTAKTGWILLDIIWNKTSDLQLFSIWRKVMPAFNTS